jgi:hypothetical protein
LRGGKAARVRAASRPADAEALQECRRGIDAKDERAARWYERFGALPLLDDPLKLVLPLNTVAAALSLATSRCRR